MTTLQNPHAKPPRSLAHSGPSCCRCNCWYMCTRPMPRARTVARTQLAIHRPPGIPYVWVITAHPYKNYNYFCTTHPQSRIFLRPRNPPYGILHAPRTLPLRTADLVPLWGTWHYGNCAACVKPENSYWYLLRCCALRKVVFTTWKRRDCNSKAALPFCRAGKAYLEMSGKVLVGLSNSVRLGFRTSSRLGL